MGKRYEHLNAEERAMTMVMTSQNCSVRAIARTLGRCASTISREALGNTTEGRGHSGAKRAGERARARRLTVRRVPELSPKTVMTALALLVELQARYPGTYSVRQLYTLQKRVRAWRQEAVRRLLFEVPGNILAEASGNKLT